MLISYPLTGPALAELRDALTPTRYTSHREPERARVLTEARATLPEGPGTDWMPPASDPVRRLIACELRRRATYEFTSALSSDQAARLAALVMAEEHRSDLADLLAGEPQEV